MGVQDKVSGSLRGQLLYLVGGPCRLTPARTCAACFGPTRRGYVAAGVDCSGPIAEWHLLLSPPFRHLPFHLGPGPGEPAVVVPPPLLHPRLIPVGPVRHSVSRDRVEE